MNGTDRYATSPQCNVVTKEVVPRRCTNNSEFTLAISAGKYNVCARCLPAQVLYHDRNDLGPVIMARLP